MIISIIGDEADGVTPTSSIIEFPFGDGETWLELTDKWFHLLVAHGYGFLTPIEDFMEAINIVHDDALDKKQEADEEKRRAEESDEGDA